MGVSHKLMSLSIFQCLFATNCAVVIMSELFSLTLILCASDCLPFCVCFQSTNCLLGKTMSLLNTNHMGVAHLLVCTALPTAKADTPCETAVQEKSVSMESSRSCTLTVRVTSPMIWCACSAMVLKVGLPVGINSCLMLWSSGVILAKSVLSLQSLPHVTFSGHGCLANHAVSSSASAMTPWGLLPDPSWSSSTIAEVLFTFSV